MPEARKRPCTICRRGVRPDADRAWSLPDPLNEPSLSSVGRARTRVKGAHNPRVSASVLVLNAGSSTLKYAAYRADGDGTLTALVRGKVDGIDMDPVAELLERHLEGGSPSAVGHRIVH